MQEHDRPRYCHSSPNRSSHQTKRLKALSGTGNTRVLFNDFLEKISDLLLTRLHIYIYKHIIKKRGLLFVIQRISQERE